jgi:hypothetical protein
MRPGYVAGFAFVIAAPFGGASRSATLQPIRPESRIWFTGASNIRHFTCRARQLSGGLELRGIATRRMVLTGENASVQPSVSVTVDKLDCGIGVMNRHLHEALQGARHATIDFRLTTYEIDLTTPDAGCADRRTRDHRGRAAAGCHDGDHPRRHVRRHLPSRHLRFAPRTSGRASAEVRWPASRA